MARVKQRKIATLKRGLFLVRYVAAEDDVRPPTVTVTFDRKQRHTLLLVLHPDHSDPVLSRPGSCLVVVAAEPGELIVEVNPSRSDGSSAATVQIEPLTQGDPGTRLPAPQLIGRDGGLRVLGHVAGIGDVFVAADEWLAGPAAPSRIEGIELEWPDKPDQVDLRYAVTTARPQPVSGRMMQLGEYAGTRGRALPITGVVLELSGRKAALYEMRAEAIFLGSPRTEVAGQRTALTGPTGREPLVGFRVQVGQLTKSAAVSRPRVASTVGRVRVFRSQGQSASAVVT
jgi:hypothetical protein